MPIRNFYLLVATIVITICSSNDLTKFAKYTRTNKRKPYTSLYFKSNEKSVHLKIHRYNKYSPPPPPAPQFPAKKILKGTNKCPSKTCKKDVKRHVFQSLICRRMYSHHLEHQPTHCSKQAQILNF